MNKRDEWPDKDLWDRLAAENDGHQPAREMRCQRESGGFGELCGLPRHAEEEGQARCIFHYSGERDPDELREQLEAAVRSGAQLWFASLSGAELGDTELNGADVPHADLSGAELWDAKFRKANLSHADLSGANLHGAYLSEAKLWYVNLSGAYLPWANLSGADLWRATLTGDIDLRRANLRGACLLDFELSTQAKLDGAQWGEGAIVQDEIDARSEEDRSRFADCAAIYRQIKMSYQESGDYQTAGQFFIREMECRRFALAAEGPPTAEDRGPLPRAWNWLSHYATRAVWCLSYYTCQHAESPTRVLGIMAVLILLFGVIHSLVGIQDSAHGFVIARGAHMGPIGEIPAQIVNALYFSAVTFTSLGYGDMRPHGSLGQFFVCFQAVLGVICIAVFAGAIIRKVSS